MNERRLLAEKLLEIRAVSLNVNVPYIWASGIQSPIYCDNRLTLGYPELREKIAKGMKRLIELHFPDTDLIAGTATAGIPHAAWVSHFLGLPMCYVRSSSKGHGKKNQIEGYIQKGQKVVVIEDLISTGKSSLQAAKALQEAGLNVLGVVAIFTYELEKAKEQFREAGIPHHTLTNFSTLLEVAMEKEYISGKDYEYILKWRENPEAWGK